LWSLFQLHLRVKDWIAALTVQVMSARRVRQVRYRNFPSYKIR
jgi:hypothetical protein